ncbi:MAG: exodeoxyribonuclease VII large subunit, partial [Firmicutes bacterium]|nr:exodeoxyribonuclease VII large subunit [Bacillota bacterium]
LPPFPKKIAVVTSPAGAAVRDIIRVLGRRWPLAEVLILPVRVQGAEAPPEIAAALEYANRQKAADLIIAGRGGGSIEDLWAFNDERVARAIYASEIPVISAVGHEPDVTIADFVADLRAATPSNAAELAVPDALKWREALYAAEIRISADMSKRLETCRRRLSELSSRRVMQSPTAYFDERRQALDFSRTLLVAHMERLLSARRRVYITHAATLDALSPLKVLSRGYAIAEAADGTIIKSVAQVRAGDCLRLRVTDGEIPCEVL